ncbi:MAG: histidine phosphatase family protein [Synergistaceae bacterium]|jgi:probable phosphoglycerate mutase|nr:histidine phosphatase family protein [Synergistaceae bacterium]
MKIFLLRHGKPQFPDERKYVYGRTDFPLSDAGKNEAKAIGKALAAIPMDRIISSDLARAAETARIVSGLQKKKLCAVEQDPSLREIDMGEWDGLTKDEIAEGYVDIFRKRGKDIANVTPPGGESLGRLQARGIAAFERIAEESKGLRNVLITAHGAIMWSIVSGLFGLPLDGLYSFGLDYCGVHLIEHCGSSERPWGKYRLIRYNWSPKLSIYMEDIV